MSLRYRLADWADYLGAVFVANNAIRKLDAVRTRALDFEQALKSLEELKEYFESGKDKVFLDYIGLRNLEKRYVETHKKAVSLLVSAEGEIRSRSASKGVDELISFLEEFANICLIEGRELSLA